MGPLPITHLGMSASQLLLFYIASAIPGHLLPTHYLVDFDTPRTDYLCLIFSTGADAHNLVNAWAKNRVESYKLVRTSIVNGSGDHTSSVFPPPSPLLSSTTNMEKKNFVLVSLLQAIQADIDDEKQWPIGLPSQLAQNPRQLGNIH
ncbi:hypothetical protein C8J57DRAFT_1732820 [Mycena rebaudengoi]|nr:hypothetical protein C8J57DRAFT_1732820 [Mycena rebaudengoi]